MITAAFSIICLLGTGFFTVFFFALCKDGKRHQKCVSIERLFGADYELDLDSPHDLARPRIVSIEQHSARKAARRFRTGTSGAAD